MSGPADMRSARPAAGLSPMEFYYSMEQVARAMGLLMADGSPNTRLARYRMCRKPCVAVKRGGRWFTTKSLLRRRRPEESGELIARMEL